jgi:hypothetical protein
VFRRLHCPGQAASFPAKTATRASLVSPEDNKLAKIVVLSLKKTRRIANEIEKRSYSCNKKYLGK